MRIFKLLVKTFPWKLALFAVASIAVWLFFYHRGQVDLKPPDAHKRADYIPTTDRVAVAYREINEDSFFGALPEKKTTVVLGDLSSVEELGHVTRREDGTWLITIDKAGHPTLRQAEMTEIHEMCHQAVMGNYMHFAGQKDSGLSGHDGAFEACMISVAVRHGFKDLW